MGIADKNWTSFLGAISAGDSTEIHRSMQSMAKQAVESPKMRKLRESIEYHQDCVARLRNMSQRDRYDNENLSYHVGRLTYLLEQHSTYQGD